MHRDAEQQNEIGTTAGILIVVVLLLSGGVYFLTQQIGRERQIEALKTQATSSDSITSIKNDASSLNFSDLGSGVNNL